MIPSLVIFDCDGVLVDSEIIAQEVSAEALAMIEHPISIAEFRQQALGRRIPDINAMLEAHWGKPLPASYHTHIHDVFVARIEERLQPVRGIDGVLRGVALPKCVASSSSQDHIRRSLGLTGLASHFGENLFSGHEVEYGKPAPDLFLYAARNMGVAPADCVVIEDSRFGVMGAKAAGMYAIGFLAGLHCDADHGEMLRAAGADVIARDAVELARLLAPA